jgi:hypothetical protein
MNDGISKCVNKFPKFMFMTLYVNVYAGCRVIFFFCVNKLETFGLFLNGHIILEM